MYKYAATSLEGFAETPRAWSAQVIKLDRNQMKQTLSNVFRLPRPAQSIGMMCACVATTLLVGCGGGGGGGSSTSTPSGISGVAAKGIIQGATVTAYQLTSAGQGAELGSTTTGTRGDYSLDFTSSYAGPVLIKVTHNDGATAVCDFPDGCPGNVAFGATYDLESDFEMSAAAASSSVESLEANITPLTTVAADLALNSNDPTDVASANSKVADLFGLTGDPTQAPVVDITVNGAMDDLNATQMQFLMIGIAIAEAAISGDATTISAAIKRASNQIATEGVSEAPVAGKLSITDVLTKASANLTNNAVTSKTTNAELATVQTTVAALKSTKENGSTELTQGRDIDVSTGMIAAKNIVNQVRDFAYHTQSTDENFTAFGEELDTIRDTVEADNKQGTLDAWFEAVEATGEFVNEYYDLPDADRAGAKTERTTVVDGNTYTVKRSGTTFTVEEFTNEDGVTLSLQATTTLNDDQYTETNTGDVYTESGNISASLAVSGSSQKVVDGATVLVEVLDGSAISMRVDNIDARDEYANGKTVADNFAATINLDADLKARITHTKASKETSFNGTIGFTVDDLEVNEVFTDTNGEITDTTDSKFKSAIITLTGTFKNPDNEVEATVSLAGTDIDESCDDTSGGNCVLSDDTQNKLSMTVTFGYDYTGVDSDATVAITASIEGDSSDATLDGDQSFENKGILTTKLTYSGGRTMELKYDGSTLKRDGSTNKERIVATNQDGAQLILTLDTVADELVASESSVQVNGETYSKTVEEDTNGIYTITFTDDTFTTI